MADNPDARGGYNSYPKDEFDDPPEGPVGVHRGRRPLSVRLAPYLIVLLVAAIAGLGVWLAVSGSAQNLRLPWQSAAQTSDAQGGRTSSATTPAQTQTSSPSSASEQPSTTDTTTSASPSDTAGTINKAASIRVVNGVGRQGYAAQKQALLQAASYTNVTAANPTGTLPAASVVWYINDDDEATAQDVATRLGIQNVQQQSGIAAPIVAVLME